MGGPAPCPNSLGILDVIARTMHASPKPQPVGPPACCMHGRRAVVAPHAAGAAALAAAMLLGPAGQPCHPRGTAPCVCQSAAVIIALEVVRDMGLPSDVPLHQPPPPSGATAQSSEGATEGEQQAAEGSKQLVSQGAAAGAPPGPAAAAAAESGLEQRSTPGFVLACDPGRVSRSRGSSDQGLPRTEPTP